MRPDRAQFQTMNRRMIERIGTMPHAPLVENGYALRVVRTTGRRTGAPRAVPLAVVSHDGRRWLVAPSGVRDWVANLDAHPSCTVDGDGSFTAQRSTGRDAAPAAQLYCRAAEGTQSRFPFPPDADLDAVLAALPQMAVFELTSA